MCGIVGAFAFTDDAKSCFDLMPNAVASLSKRGPDCSNVKMLGDVCLGHSRLSVIDLSEQASQPLTDRTNRYTIVLNGEIFNYRQLRTELEQGGVEFRTQSDTEVLLQLYINKGVSCLDKLVGFFAFAIFDKQKNSLFIARDRMGQKPLLYCHTRNSLVFASEMKALTALGIPREIDKASLSLYFQLNYIPAPYTIFQDVKKLQPGYYMTVENGIVHVEQYYKIPAGQNFLHNITYEQAQTKIRELIAQSVADRMVADVPLGAFLSGGIDSSVIVAEASKLKSGIDTFSIGYADEPMFDETRYAELVAKRFGTNHHVYKLTNADLYSELYNLLNYIDEPYADSSALPSYILSKNARQHVTVALSGDGADELFGGYNKHQAAARVINGDWRLSALKLTAPIWQVLPQSRNGKLSNFARQACKMIEGAKLSAPERYWRWATLMSNEKAYDLLNRKLQLQEVSRRTKQILSKFRGGDDIEDILLTDMNLVLEGDMLHKVDLASMANSLEVRSPFMDHRLVNYVSSLPVNYLVTNNMRKQVLQDAYKNELPIELYRRKKQGFEVPLLNWMRGDLRSTIENEFINEEFLREQGIFNVSEIKLIWEQLLSKSPADAVAHMWAIIVFQHWWKKFSV